MPRYSAVLEVEFDAFNENDALKIATHLANGQGSFEDTYGMTGHVTPHTVRLAEEPEERLVPNEGFY